MTDYPALKRAHSPWKKRKVERKWQEVLAVFVVLGLIVVIVGGLLKTFSFGRDETSSWDSDEALAIALNSSPGAVVVYGKTPAKLGVFEIGKDLYFATGDAKSPVSPVEAVFDLPGEKAAGALSNLTGVNVNKFVYFKKRPELGGDGAYSLFKDFSSLKTPFAIVFSGKKSIDSTNMSSVELLTLWWKVKGIPLGNFHVKNLEDFADWVIGPGDGKFKGLDRESVWRELFSYFDGGGVKKGEVEIVNDSGVSGAGKLASSIIGAYGFDVSGVSTSDSIGEGCRLVVFSRVDDVSKLAGSLGCDIVLRQDSSPNGKIIMFLGREFVLKYF